MKKGYIVLENGQVFEGERFGAKKDVIGELVFTTGVEGYIETLTDPCYYGQIILQTFPLIGNYGWIDADTDGREIKAFAYIVREWCEAPSNFRSEGDINAELSKRGVAGICGVDTRELTRIIRENGVLNACITDDPKSVDMDALRAYKVKSAVANVVVAGEKVKKYPSCSEEKYKVTVINYGNTFNIVSKLNEMGCSVSVVPFDTTAESILDEAPDGIVLSDGPGNPTENRKCIAEIKKLIGTAPIFAVGLGHQMLAIAMGAKTYKLKVGHRGGNQPVKSAEYKGVYITAQNHGYAVKSESVEKVGGRVIFTNGNDGTCAGVLYGEKRAFSIQFNPAACSGPENSDEFTFGRFVNMMGGKN
ncbi:MAG: carbamoyl phosphate synthase small subunit [Clostridia bacterium]|nr:carbamoyl phosphate synthase small subunit [Clostridia bacterium]